MPDFAPAPVEALSADEVYIVEADPSLADALKHALGDARLRVRTFSKAVDFLDNAPLLAPGCVITEAHVSGMSGLALIREIKHRELPFASVLMTGQGDVSTAVAAMQAGATDVIETPFRLDALTKGVDRAVRVVSRRTGEAWAHSGFRRGMSQLTPRERDVLCGVLAGRSNKEIALKLGISHRTVELHRAKVMLKTQTRTLADLVRLAVNQEPNLHAAA